MSRDDGERSQLDRARLLAEYHEASVLNGRRIPDGAASAAAPWQRLRACLHALEQLRVTQATATIADCGDLTNAAELRLPMRFGRFEIRRELGRGGHGVVYQAYDPVLKRDVALKVPRIDTLASPVLRRRFLMEARAVANLSHPHLVQVYEVGEVGPACLIASEYCPGSTLSRWLGVLYA